MKTRRITLPVVLSVSALLFSACALTRPDEPDAARWPNAMSDSWEATEPNGRNIEVWILREDGDLSVIGREKKGDGTALSSVTGVRTDAG